MVKKEKLPSLNRRTTILVIFCCSCSSYSAMVGSDDGTGRFQCQGVLLIWKVAQQWATVLAVGMGGDWFDFVFFSS